MKRKILCIDDIETNLFTIKSVIENAADDKYEVLTASSAADGLSILLKQKIDIILLDVMMPDINGYEAAKMIKGNKRTKYIPIIFVTANKDDETIESCYSSGGSDYVNKPFNHIELLARIAFHLSLRDKELVIQERESELMHEANYDSLTQIYNRNIFHRLIKEKIERVEESRKPFVLIMLDIDHFKKINDTYGHLVGDNILKSMTQLIKSHIRESDVFARWGGEEFVLSFNVPILKGVEIAQNLRKHIDEYVYESVGNITCSFGVTEFRLNDDIDSMLKRADEALYEAKNGGRNRVCQA